MPCTSFPPCSPATKQAGGWIRQASRRRLSPLWQGPVSESHSRTCQGGIQLEVPCGWHGLWTRQRRSRQHLHSCLQQLLCTAGAAEACRIWGGVIHAWLEERQLSCLNGFPKAKGPGVWDALGCRWGEDVQREGTASVVFGNLAATGSAAACEQRQEQQHPAGRHLMRLRARTDWVLHTHLGLAPSAGPPRPQPWRLQSGAAPLELAMHGAPQQTLGCLPLCAVPGRNQCGHQAASAVPCRC